MHVMGYGGLPCAATTGKLLATSDMNGRTSLWEVATRIQIATLTDPGSQGVVSAAFSPDGKILATADMNGRTYLWDITERR
jgi:WD40 repeat protein